MIVFYPLIGRSPNYYRVMCSLNSYNLLEDNFTSNNLSNSSTWPPDSLLPIDTPLDQRPPHLHPLYISIRFYTSTIVIPAIFAFGVIGNLLNLILFVHRSRSRRRLEALERAAFAGLVALALSDMLFCVVGIPPAFLPTTNPNWPPDLGVKLGYYYRMYKEGFHNLFLFTSTWIIVVISAERFVAVYYPIRARCYLQVRNSIFVYIGIAVIGLLLSVPLFVKQRIVMRECYPGCTCMSVEPTLLFHNQHFRKVYHVIWSIFGTFLPLVALALANTGLVLVLYRSRARNLTNPERYGCSHVTLTVTAIVTSFLVLVCPSMVLYSAELIFSVSRYNVKSYWIAMIVTNLMQAVKFSSNFVLYCSTIRQFRQSLNQMADCRKANSRGQESMRSTFRSRPSVM